MRMNPAPKKIQNEFTYSFHLKVLNLKTIHNPHNTNHLQN